LNRHSFFCDCSEPEHQLVFEVDDWKDRDGKWVSSDLMIYHRAKSDLTFFQRCRVYFSWLFNKSLFSYCFSDIIISDIDELERMKAVIETVISNKKAVVNENNREEVIQDIQTI